MLKIFLELIFACCVFGLGFGTSLSPEPTGGDEISMVQVHAHASASDARQFPQFPQIVSKALKPFPDYTNDNVDSSVKIGSLPFFGLDRIKSDGTQDTNTWMVMFPANFTTEMIFQACLAFQAPGKCIYAGHPDSGGLPFIIAESPSSWFSSFVTTSCSGGMPAAAHVCRAMYVEVDGPTFLKNKSPYPILKPGHGANRDSVTWGLDRSDQRVGTNGEYNPAFTGEGIHVFHLDTGVNAALADFEGRVVPALDMTVSPVKECGRHDMNCATDKQGHGTHTAGTVGSKTYGIAKKATIHAIKVLSDDGFGAWSYFIGGMDWVINHVKNNQLSPAVATASLGGNGPTFAITEVVERATQLNIVVVVAAGNEASNACLTLPSGVKSAVTVGSTDYDNGRDIESDFSNVGSCIDIFAPGRDIVSLGLTEGQEMIGSGTSMACPHVAGAVALMFQQDPQLTSKTAIRKLKGMGTKGCISSLFANTVNRLLYVGTDENKNACGGS